MKSSTKFLISVARALEHSKPIEVPQILEKKSRKSELKLMLTELEATLHVAIKSGKFTQERINLIKAKIDYLRKKLN